jgi:hypothetical protein
MSFEQETRVSLNRLQYFHEFQMFMLVLTGAMAEKI